MGASQSVLVKDLRAAVGGNDELVSDPTKRRYQAKDVKPYNLTAPAKPIAVTYPESTEQVAEIVRVAVKHNLKVQARCGGYGYANHCLGGEDGTVVVDLKHMQNFHMNQETWRATVGGGTLLGDLTKRLYHAGGRAIAHGTCPQVGLGGHATVGGLGPSSRLWGTALDHVEEVEVVLADSTIVRASTTENADLFWAVKGAGGSFGIVTEFVLRTEPAPREAVQYSFSFTQGTLSEKSAIFKKWQKFVAHPWLTRKFASQLVLSAAGLIISGTYYGTRAEYDSFQMHNIFPGHQEANTVVFKDWLGLVEAWAEDAALRLGGGKASHFFAQSLTFNGIELIPDLNVNALFIHLDRAQKGSPPWVIIFDLAGGAVNAVPQDATAYAHRDALFYMQSYGVGIGKITEKNKTFATTKTFLREARLILKSGAGHDFGSYAGYVDPELANPQKEYWRTNLPRLEQIKRAVDPTDVFHNPQSVKPASLPSEKQEKKRRRLTKLPITERRASRLPSAISTAESSEEQTKGLEPVRVPASLHGNVLPEFQVITDAGERDEEASLRIARDSNDTGSELTVVDDARRTLEQGRDGRGDRVDDGTMSRFSMD